MLKVQVCDDYVGVGEAWEYTLPLQTPWNDIQTAVRLLHPTCQWVSIEVVPVED